jgi:hypothetical protein
MQAIYQIELGIRLQARDQIALTNVVNELQKANQIALTNVVNELQEENQIALKCSKRCVKKCIKTRQIILFDFKSPADGEDEMNK